MPEVNYKKYSLIGMLFYLFIVAFAFAYPLFWGLARKGFEESFVQGQALTFGSYLANFLTYTPMMIVAILLIIFPLMNLFTLKPKQHPATASNPKWYRIFTMDFLLNPQENSFLYHLFPEKFKWLKNPLKVFWFGLLFLIPFGLLIVSSPQLSIAGVPQLQIAQQVTPGAEIGFKALLPSVAENGLLLFFMMLFSGIIAFLFAKYSRNKNLTVFFGILFFLCIILSLMWAGFHSVVDQNSEVAFVGHLVFGFLGTIFTLLTGSFIIFFLLHLVNNTSLTLMEIIAVKEDILLVGWSVWVILLAITIAVIIRRRRKNKIVEGIPA